MRKSVVMALCGLVMSTSMAAEYYWDTNGIEPGFGSAIGTLDESAYWSTDPNGTSPCAGVTTTLSDTLYFGTRDNPLRSGTITINGNVEAGNITVYMVEGDSLSFSGSGSLTLAPSANVIEGSVGQSIIFDVPVSSSGDVSFSPVLPDGHEFYPEDGAEVPNKNYDVIVLRNAKIKDVKPVKAYFNKSERAGLHATGEAKVCFITRSENEIAFQCQAYLNAYTKCTKIKAFQKGNDIAARIDYTRYYSTHGADVVGRFDFDSPKGWVNFTPYPVWNASENKFGGGYAIDYIDFAYQVPEGKIPSVIFKKKSTFVGEVANGLDCRLALEHDEAICEANASSVPIKNDGTLVFTGRPRHLSIAQNISGTGSLGTDFSWPEGETAAVEKIMDKTEWTLIAEGVPLLAVTNGSAYFTGGTVDVPATVSMYFPTYNSANKILTLQVQHYDNKIHNFTKCVYLEIKEEQGVLYARTPSTNYAEGDKRGFDFTKLAQHTEKPIATSETASGYAIKNVSLLYGKGTGYVQIGAFVSNVVEFENTTCDITKSGSWSDGIFGYRGLLCMRNGTVNLTTGSKCIGGRNKTILELDNSTMNITKTGDTTYLNNLILSNASSVVGSNVRCGYEDDAYFAIRGEGMSTFTPNVLFAKKSSGSGNRSLTFDVEDTTQDDGVDFDFASQVTLLDKTWLQVCGIKTGPGTMRMTNTWAPVYAPFTISQGVLSIGASTVFPVEEQIALNGGSLMIERDIPVSVGTLRTLAPSSIVLAEGSSLAFADSSAVAWTDGATVTIKGNLKKTPLTFGSSAEALTKDQVEALVLEDGRKVMLTPEGRVLPIPENLVIILR